MVMSHAFVSDIRREIEVENPCKTFDDVCYPIKKKERPRNSVIFARSDITVFLVKKVTYAWVPKFLVQDK